MEISRDCPYGNEPEDINIRLNAIIEDLTQIDEIYEVKKLDTTNTKIILEISTNLDVLTFKTEIKNIMSDYFCYFRLDNNILKEMKNEK